MPKNTKSDCDKLFQEIIALLYNHTCGICCKVTEGGAAHHIIGRRYMAIRWAILNGIYLCSGCHAMAHNDPGEFLMLLGRVGEIARLEFYESHKGMKPCTVLNSEMEAFRSQLRKSKEALLSHNCFGRRSG